MCLNQIYINDERSSGKEDLMLIDIILKIFAIKNLNFKKNTLFLFTYF